MALSNRERVGRMMQVLKDGLAPFIVREYRQTYGQRYGEETEAALATPGSPGLPADPASQATGRVRA
jgi:hypothetical protein